MIAFGGAGPLHACDLAEEMGIQEIVVPVHPGLFSAYGLLTGHIAWTFSKPVLSTNLNLEKDFAELKAQAQKSLGQEGFHNLILEEYAETQYQGQSFVLMIRYKGPDALRVDFDRKHKEIYGYSSPDGAIEIVNAKIRAVAKIPKLTPKKETPPQSQREKPQSISTSPRKAWISEHELVVPVLKREELLVGAGDAGPCIIEEYDSTTIVNQDWKWKIDEFRNIRLGRMTHSL